MGQNYLSRRANNAQIKGVILPPFPYSMLFRSYGFPTKYVLATAAVSCLLRQQSDLWRDVNLAHVCMLSHGASTMPIALPPPVTTTIRAFLLPTAPWLRHQRYVPP